MFKSSIRAWKKTWKTESSGQWLYIKVQHYLRTTLYSKGKRCKRKATGLCNANTACCCCGLNLQFQYLSVILCVMPELLVMFENIFLVIFCSMSHLVTLFFRIYHLYSLCDLPSACDGYHWGPDCARVCACDPIGSTYCDPNTGCQCKRGWGGMTCSEDKNECSQLATPCPSMSTCSNTAGSYLCSCNPGFQMDSSNTCSGEWFWTLSFFNLVSTYKFILKFFSSFSLWIIWSV